MNISQRLRTCAKHTALDAVIELLNEAADEIDRLQGRQQAEARTGEPVQVFLVRDVASLLGASVPDVCDALAELGYEPRRSTNAAISPDEAIAVAKRINPAPSVPDAAIDSAIYNQCPDFDNWHEGPSIDDIKAIVRAAIQQAEASKNEPVAWMHWLHGPVQVLMNKDEAMMELERLNREYPSGANDRKMRPLVFGDTHPTPGVPEFSRIAKRKLTELQEQGFAITGYAIQRAAVRGFIDGGGFVGWWQGEPAPGVPDGWRIEEKGGELIVQKNGFGGYSARKNTESIAEAVLHELALDLLAASPAQKGQP